jgi:predicted nucleotidyltransferase component of viral defense system
MPIIPLEKRLRKSIHRKLASAQDLIVETLYNFFPKAIIHGGTAIWRCYNSKRFSEDIDVYIPKETDKEVKFQDFTNALKSNEFTVKKFKFTNNSVFSKLKKDDVEIRFEVTFKNLKNFLVKPFEASDGTFMNVYTLFPDDLIIEKILAYKSRKKVRDLYDIWFLLNLIEDKEKIRTHIIDLLKHLEKPKDYKTLKALIILGPVPSIENLIEGIKSWGKRNI